MPKTTPPAPTKEKYQKSQESEVMYFWRILPPYVQPDWILANRWREIVASQPVATICKETLISNFLALDWSIQARDTNQRDELKKDIEYYTKFLTDSGDLNYSEHVEWVLQDLLDLPFGGASEIGREGDKPEGKVLWIEPLDGSTLFPTLNNDFPVGQRIEVAPLDVVYFPKHCINRIYMSPRTRYQRKGWGVAPPEKIYLALELLKRGDIYYANLLLDTPQAGILDLSDMEKESAEAWVDSYRSLLNGIDPFKIPVLYEHEKPANFIAFGKPPTDLMFDRISLKYAAIIAAGYGMSLGDIGMSVASNGGETMSGTIRQERRTRRTGQAVIKKKMVEYFNRILPETLRFVLVDYDDELSVAMGRARMANATAYGTLIDKRTLTPKEARLQMIADGLITIPIPEDPPEEDFPPMLSPLGTPERPGMLGNPKAPSQGGYGEGVAGVGKSAVNDLRALMKQNLDSIAKRADDPHLEKLIRKVAPRVFAQVKVAASELSERSDYDQWVAWHELALTSSDVEEDVRQAMEVVCAAADPPLEEEDWWQLDLSDDDVLAILLSAYLLSLRSSADELIRELYLNGYLASPYLDPSINFSLTNEWVLRQLSEYAADMVRNINDGTKYYLKRILVRSIRDGLSEADILAKIRAGADIDSILSDNTFMQRMADSVRQDLARLTEDRLKSIISYEISRAENQAYLDQYKRVGLKTKAWEHVGADEPCEHCTENMKAGYVPLDYEFRSSFGTCEAPPAHPHEHCHIIYNRSELYSLASQGKFNIWTGD